MAPRSLDFGREPLEERIDAERARALLSERESELTGDDDAETAATATAQPYPGLTEERCASEGDPSRRVIAR